MWRSSFLHHGNRCSCFHWPGASLTLLAVVLLLACCGGQPAGRYTAHSPGGGGGGGFFLSLAAQHLGLSVSCPPYPPGETGNCPPAVRAWVKWESAPPAAVRSRREWGGQCGALGWLGCRAPPPRAGQDPQDTLPSHCQPRGGAGERLRALPPAAPQPHPHWAARPAEASGGRTETTGRHWPNPG